MKRIIYIYTLLIIFLLPIYSLNAQITRGSKIADGSNERLDFKPHNFAILELDSKEKGFMFPRMTTVQRDAIQIDKKANNGLAIFNTTIDCIEYFNQSLDIWVSLCGDDLPANFSILDSNCADIKVIGGYYKGRQLDVTNGILIKVTVSSPGVYDVIAESNNGYSFTAEGKFPESGVYTIFLKAEGIPKKGYQNNELGDEISFSLNGIKSSCVKNIFVDIELPKYSFLEVKTLGKYFINMDVTNKEFIEAVVDVTRGGKWVVKSNKVNGVWFEGEGVFEGLGKQVIKLYANGQPKSHGDSKIVITANPEYGSGKPQTNIDAIYHTDNVAFDLVDCDNVEYSHKAEYGNKLPIDAKMTLNIKVKAPGVTRITASNSSNGKTVIFDSGEIELKYSRDGENIQKAVLNILENNNDVGAGGMLTMGIKGKGLDAKCDVKMPVLLKELTWDVKDIKLVSKFEHTKRPYITPRTTMPKDGSDDFKILVNIDVLMGGNIQMETNVVNGVYFKGSKVLDKKFSGTTTVELKAYGKSETDMKRDDAKYTIVSNHIDPAKRESEFKVDYVYRPMNIMGFGKYTVNTSLTSSTNSNNSNAMLKNSKLFGWDGIVRVAELNMLDSKGDYTGSIAQSSANNMLTYIKKSDVVFVSGQVKKNEERLKDLYQATVNNKMVLIYTERYNSKTGSNVAYYEGMQSFLRNFSVRVPVFKAIYTEAAAKGWTMNDLSSTYPILYDNKFFKEYDKSSNNILNTKFGSIMRTDNGAYSFSIASKQVPNGFRALYKAANNDVTGLIHDNLGVVLLFNESPFIGSDVITNSINLKNPLFTTGESGVNAHLPAVNTLYGIEKSESSISVYNSYHLLNILYWAIDYAQENQPNVIKPK